MTFLELARTRQSHRAFTSQVVRREDLLTCVQAAQLAPSACNSQPWKFVIIDDAAKAKDAVAIQIMEQFGAYLGRGLAAIACVVNPEVFVIGGGVSKAGEMLFDVAFDKILGAEILPDSFRNQLPKIVSTRKKLGNFWNTAETEAMVGFLSEQSPLHV